MLAKTLAGAFVITVSAPLAAQAGNCVPKTRPDRSPPARTSRSASDSLSLVSVVSGSATTASTGSLPITGGGRLLAGAAAAGVAASGRRRAS